MFIGQYPIVTQKIQTRTMLTREKKRESNRLGQWKLFCTWRDIQYSSNRNTFHLNSIYCMFKGRIMTLPFIHTEDSEKFTQPRIERYEHNNHLFYLFTLCIEIWLHKTATTTSTIKLRFFFSLNFSFFIIVHSFMLRKSFVQATKLKHIFICIWKIHVFTYVNFQFHHSIWLHFDFSLDFSFWTLHLFSILFLDLFFCNILLGSKLRLEAKEIKY